MFKKSLLVGSNERPPQIGRYVIRGYEVVRTTPQDLPHFLTQRLRAGKDVISIWFKHANEGLFRDLEEWRDIKLTTSKFNSRTFLPTIDEMNPREVLEFCKSIEVHPAHLVPFNEDMKLSLPTRLLEVLIGIAEGKTPKEDGGFDFYSSEEIYLARAAIAFECRRIRKFLGMRKHAEVSGDRNTATLTGIFKDVMGNPRALNNIIETIKAKKPDNFYAPQSLSYRYFDRLGDRAIIALEEDIERSHCQLRVKQELYKERIRHFVHEYRKIMGDRESIEAEAMTFLDSVLEKISNTHISKRGLDIRENKETIFAVMREWGLVSKKRIVAQNLYAEKFGEPRLDTLDEDELFLSELEDPQVEELAYALRLVLDGEYGLKRAEQRHSQIEGEYILDSSRIRHALESVSDLYERRMLDNLVLLRLFNYSVEENSTPMSTPKNI